MLNADNPPRGKLSKGTVENREMKPRAEWRLCHPVNIYVFKNGVTGELPTLVHIPADKKRNMESVLEAIQERLRSPVGYPKALYKMDGCQVCETFELEMYENYVSVSNLETRFKCVEYGMARSPLVVIGRESKNVRSILLQNKDFDRIRRKQSNDKRKYAFASNYTSDGFGPSDLPYVSNISKPCGVLCQKPKCLCPPKRSCETYENPSVSRYNSTETSNDMSDDGFLINYLRESFDMQSETSQTRSCQQPEVYSVQMVDKSIDADQIPSIKRNSSIDSDHLIEFINRYRDIGGELNRLFTDRMSIDYGIKNKLGKTKVGDKPSRDSRVGGDLVRMFSDRLDTEESLDADAESLKTLSSGVRKQSQPMTSYLPSLGDLKDIDDGNTGNETATRSSSEQLSRYESTVDRQKSLSTLINDTPSQVSKTGTTASKKDKTVLYCTSLQQDRTPFVVKNGQLVPRNEIPDKIYLLKMPNHVSDSSWTSSLSIDSNPSAGIKIKQQQTHLLNPDEYDQGRAELRLSTIAELKVGRQNELTPSKNTSRKKQEILKNINNNNNDVQHLH